jgi:hypothetical protein
MDTLAKPRTDRPPTITQAIRRRAYAKFFARAMVGDERQREAALRAIELLVKLREGCKERKIA